MDARASTSETQQSLRPSSWAAVAATAVATPAPFLIPDSSSSDVVGPSLQSHFEFLPFLFPQQSNIYHAQLLHYNKLVSPSRGGGLQTPSLPLVVSAPHAQAGSRSRSSSKVSLKDAQTGETTAAGGHGSKSRASQDKSRSVVASKDAPPRMPAKQQHVAEQSTAQSHSSTTVAATPQAQCQSSSVPSTPHQHSRQFSFESHGPSPTGPTSHSPRSVYSETNSTLPSLKPLPPRYGRCKYETAQMHSRRRIPYSVGNERLEKLDLRNVKSRLSKEEEARLSADVDDLFGRLLPTEAVEATRSRLVHKLERIFNEEWPGHNIQVHLFGSSGNLLCSDDSDVDICITTPWRELEDVCKIANLLAHRGMEKVVCISAAKVPIVKVWDPELGLACDMNVNNTLALENTRMVRTYVEADPRVRQLAMIIKYWTRRRVVNDAGLGGTLSSYTWICLIIAFLQLRNPPVLPALHQLPHKLPKADGTVSQFADNLDEIRGFGARNTSSVPELLFQFFRFYAHEFNYDKYVLSVRQGRLMTKSDKHWMYHMNNQLCVEEPFNVSRNLGNTADEYAFRGLHLELRRAFGLISAAKLGEACEQYIFPKEEERVWTRPAQQPRPALLRSSSQTHSAHSTRGGRGGYRSGRHHANHARGAAAASGGHSSGAGGSSSGPSRRASSGMTYDNSFLMTPMNVQQEMAWYPAQHFPYQYTQQDIMSHFAYQENMRQLQLMAAQSPAFGSQAQAVGQQQHPMSSAISDPTGAQQSEDRTRTNSFDNMALGASLRQDLYAYYTMGLGHGYLPHAASPTWSTHSSSAHPVGGGGLGHEFRRSSQRTMAMNDGGLPAASCLLRSQSQPASRTSSAAYPQASHRGSQTPTTAPAFVGGASVNGQGLPIPSFIPDEADFDETPRAAPESPVTSEDDARSAGFFQSRAAEPAPSPPGERWQPSPPPQGHSNGLAFGDVSTGRRRLSTDQLPQTILDRRMKRESRSPSPLGHTRSSSTSSAAAGAAATSSASQSQAWSRPLVVNGSGLKSIAVSGTQQASQGSPRPPQPDEHPCGTSSMDAAVMKPGSGMAGSGQGGIRSSAAHALPSTVSPKHTAEQLPPVANGIDASRRLGPLADDASFRERVAAMAAQHISPTGYEQETTAPGSPAHHSHSRRPPWAPLQHLQNSGGGPADVARSDQCASKSSSTETAHLSPVYEATALSPKAARQREGFWPSISTESQAPPARKAATRGDVGQPRPSKAIGTGIKSQDSRVKGHVRGAKSENEGGWQKAVKGKKRAANVGVAPGNVERPPKHESERKGG